MREKFFFSRHTKRADDPFTGKKIDKPESKDYPGITQEGVEQAQEQTKEIIDLVDDSSPDAIIFIGGSSEEVRTKSTANVYGDTLDEHYQDDEDTIVISQQTITDSRELDPDFTLRSYTQDLIADNPDKKIVISHPIYLKQFSLYPHFRDPDTGQHSEYSKQLYDAARNSETAATDIFMDSGPADSPTPPPTNPQKLAEQHLEGISRLRKFTRRFAGDREVTVGLVGHGWNLDALSSYLANQGQAGSEGYQKTHGRMIRSPEIGHVTIADDEASFTYRNETYPINPEHLEPKD